MTFHPWPINLESSLAVLHSFVPLSQFKVAQCPICEKQSRVWVLDLKQKHIRSWRSLTKIYMLPSVTHNWHHHRHKRRWVDKRTSLTNCDSAFSSRMKELGVELDVAKHEWLIKSTRRTANQHRTGVINNCMLKEMLKRRSMNVSRKHRW